MNEHNQSWPNTVCTLCSLLLSSGPHRLSLRLPAGSSPSVMSLSRHFSHISQGNCCDEMSSECEGTRGALWRILESMLFKKHFSHLWDISHFTSLYEDRGSFIKNKSIHGDLFAACQLIILFVKILCILDFLLSRCIFLFYLSHEWLLFSRWHSNTFNCFIVCCC